MLPSAAARLDAARASVLGIEPPILIIGATRAAADEFAFALAAEKGATFGITRSSLAELVVGLAIPALSRKGLTPSAPLSDEAVAARVTDDLMTKDALNQEADMDLQTALDTEAQVQASLMTHPDFREAYEAFVAKRPPRFQ